MSLALAALGRLGRALMPGGPGVPSEFEQHRRIGSEGPSERRPFKLTKFHIIFMISAVASLSKCNFEKQKATAVVFSRRCGKEKIQYVNYL